MHQNSLNLRTRGMGKSATLAINEKSAQLQASGKTVYRFGLGQSPFPVPDCVVQALKDNAHQKDYLPVQGLPELQHSVAGSHNQVDQINIEPDHVMIGPGSKELMFILQLVFYGEILIPSPCWVSYQPQADIIGRKVRFISTSYKERWRIMPHHLLDIIKEDNDPGRPRLLILNYPGNPEGQSYSEDELEAIATIARKYNIIILSDEIYGRIHHEGKHISIARFYPEGTIVSSGLSKWCGAGGWRIGTFSFPKELIWLLEPMNAVASETYTSVSAPIQYGAITAYEGGNEIDEYLIHSRRILKVLGTTIFEILQQANIRIHKPEGAFYLFPDFSDYSESLHKRNIFDSQTFCETLLNETGVALLPGSAFGRNPEEFTSRLAYVNFNGEKALNDSMKIPLNQELNIQNLGGNIDSLITGVNQIINWIQ
ncbi:MAG: aminotransferase class I/II-fold pyridoxal phosphate-dependent enzyme [Candidatus Marinimicrobia bacterium]|jgi:aspartate aminotransferase|nr:aminotransferase class I/II-fold pyridoxal phosphate-dependent enzyme [Candidatus Neomarinimicrobiota bacterium]MBT3500713.1 aminotransferase class I/II-fold pyridoxal phosphate-dependent enzyme [Candidatus Neomarinimicrobiota bacterium]MBT3839561.1 aminotransferase class I/II-fold pyridoxal phosphate-dependent enzyme [Candidatus Neomarinimicrobiota bacterium]MBT3998909.1 aminotransferase class I/II-fold pyridoxal phosphate-dependent enzyme [Candidatus Neomarinimicrobiota bacterium]MBT428315